MTILRNLQMTLRQNYTSRPRAVNSMIGDHDKELRIRIQSLLPTSGGIKMYKWFGSQPECVIFLNIELFCKDNAVLSQ